ncbi:MAG: energy transducer TonB, partial [Prevotella sp.]
TALPQDQYSNLKPTPFRIVEQMPEFPGGATAFIQWLTHQLRYPPAAMSKKIEGTVVVSFIVNTNGSIVDLKLEKSVNSLLDQEAIRVIRMMPKWKPGLQNNKPCRTMVAVPIVFHL